MLRKDGGHQEHDYILPDGGLVGPRGLASINLIRVLSVLLCPQADLIHAMSWRLENLPVAGKLWVSGKKPPGENELSDDCNSWSFLYHKLVIDEFRCGTIIAFQSISNNGRDMICGCLYHLLTSALKFVAC